MNEVGETKAAFSGCNLKPNQCVRKLQTMCETNFMSTSKPAMDSKLEICKARYLQQQARKLSKWYGMKHRMDSSDRSGKLFNPLPADHDCQAFANSLEPDLVRFQAVCHSVNMSSKFKVN